jgi:hypothetical protein
LENREYRDKSDPSVVPFQKSPNNSKQNKVMTQKHDSFFQLRINSKQMKCFLKKTIQSLVAPKRPRGVAFDKGVIVYEAAPVRLWTGGTGFKSTRSFKPRTKLF